MYFKDIKVGTSFVCNGTVYVKRSSRTAGWSKDRWFYFGQNEVISSKVKVDDTYYGA